MTQFVLEIPRPPVCSSCQYWNGMSLLSEDGDYTKVTKHSIVVSMCEVLEKFTAGSFSCSSWKGS
jgi:hypothetical protein